MVLRPVPSLAALIAVSVIGGGCPWWPFWPGVAPDGGPDGVPCGETVEDPGGLGSWTTCPHFGPVRALKGPATGGDVQMLAPISTTETFFVTSGRLGRYAQGRIERFDFRDHGAVTALAPGLVPGMAFGTDRGFVGWWTGEALVGVSLPNEERVRSVTVSELGRVWALQSSQVTEVDPASLEHRSWPSPDERVSSIVVEPEGSPWVSTSHELFRLGDGAEWARVIPESEGYDDLRLVRSAADTAWFQTSGPGPTNRLFQVDRKSVV